MGPGPPVNARTLPMLLAPSALCIVLLETGALHGPVQSQPPGPRKPCFHCIRSPFANSLAAVRRLSGHLQVCLGIFRSRQSGGYSARFAPFTPTFLGLNTCNSSPAEPTHIPCTEETQNDPHHCACGPRRGGGASLPASDASAPAAHSVAHPLGLNQEPNGRALPFFFLSSRRCRDPLRGSLGIHSTSRAPPFRWTTSPDLAGDKLTAWPPQAPVAGGCLSHVCGMPVCPQVSGCARTRH